ncbi:MAG TPA: hypothetical protein VFF16_05335 [Telluria sp.]|nr:hypothetical protein [Telluria sp.]
MKAPPGSGTDLPGALQAQVLHGVLPYLQSIHGKTFVVVCEGAVLEDPALRSGLGRDVALLHLVGLRLVLLNSGSFASMSALSHEHEDLVAVVNQHGCRAIGITGSDGGAAGLAGGLVQRLHAKGFVPVIMPVLLDARGQRELADADRLAADLARELRAEKLLFIGDAPGALSRDGRLLADLTERQIKARGRAGTIEGATLARLQAATHAVSGGVNAVHIIDGHRLHALLLELLGGASGGTTVLPDKAMHFMDDSRRYMG